MQGPQIAENFVAAFADIEVNRHAAVVAWSATGARKQSPVTIRMTNIAIFYYTSCALHLYSEHLSCFQPLKNSISLMVFSLAEISGLKNKILDDVVPSLQGFQCTAGG